MTKWEMSKEFQSSKFKFLGAIIVVVVIFSSAYLWKALMKEPLRQAAPFQLDTVQPKTPQDYILLGQKIDINTASVELFDALPGIGPALAERIVEYRTKYGPFKNVDDLQEVKGIGPKVLGKLKPYIY